MEKKNYLILIVDDSPTMRLIIQKSLVEVGFNVIQAENGEAALSLMETAKPDAILLDVEMPGLDGFDVCREIRKKEKWRYTPIMMVTGLEDYDSINKAYQEGATDFVSKPINATLLAYRVRYMIRTNDYFQELQMAEKKVHVLNNELIDKLLEIQQNAVAVARFVPQDFLKVLNRKNIAAIQLGDCIEKTMSVLFLDIKSFTSIAERMAPADVFKLFNTLMRYLEPAIIKNSGFIDKYVGDAVLALFDTADDAVNAGLDMLQALHVFNEEQQGDNFEPINMGIGINTGSVIIGTVGFEERMDCSVISDAVNLAARLETRTRDLGIELLISENTYNQLNYKEKIDFRDLGTTSIKGKSLPIKIYEVYSHNSPAQIELKKATSSIFTMGLNHYEKGQFNQASSYFKQVLSSNPYDASAKYFLEHCEGKKE